MWGPKIRDYLETTVIPLLPDFIMIVETKLTGAPSKKAQKWFHKRGYTVKFSAATHGAGKGRHGGVLIAWLHHLHVDPLAPQRHTSHVNLMGGRGHDWALVLLRVRHAAYLIGPVYLTSGQEFEGDNFTKLYQIRKCSSFYAAHLALVWGL